MTMTASTPPFLAGFFAELLPHDSPEAIGGTVEDFLERANDLGLRLRPRGEGVPLGDEGAEAANAWLEGYLGDPALVGEMHMRLARHGWWFTDGVAEEAEGVA